MAGLSVTVVQQPPEDYGPRLDREKVLAHWFVGFDGARWINALVASGDAKQVKDGGYPDLYTALACAIVPLFVGDKPPYDGRGGMFAPREIEIEQAGLKACPPDELLTIAVWDQS
jgi:hypothetical protein